MITENYNRINKISGWFVFGIASVVYILTAEPTASFWDCGEYIATAYKLQVGHPPGAPLFQIVGRVFTLFAFGNTAHVAMMVNIMSGLSSSFTILFLFWSLTILGKKLALRTGEMTPAKIYAVTGGGLVGSLAYTFSDSFWFSAVEGEVYAMSSFFTALVFWAILKWDETNDERSAQRWLIFIAYMVGLSIGVHLLNLLAIPAIAFVYYFKKHDRITYRGIIITFFISILILGFVMSGIIPWIVKLAGYFELLFVNSLGMPFNTGTIIYFLLITGGLIFGVRYTIKKRKIIYNTIVWGFVFMLIGYSSFFLLIIRSNANTPIDENNPEDAISLLAYLNREQYGDWPLIHGQYYNAPIADRKDGNPVYRKNRATGKYEIIDARKGTIPVYNSDFTTLFPRMWNDQEQRYINDYKEWSRMKGIPVRYTDESGESKTLDKPTFAENLRFFFRYQLAHMYFRYFMWNYSGRQDDIQGTADRKNGNWITGIGFLDKARLGPVMDVPGSLANKANNKFYLLPLILGITGMLYQLKTDRRNFGVIFLLFFMTGIAIVVYLNQHSPQPRERDYAYAASFYAFSVWIGLGVYALFHYLHKRIDPRLAAIGITSASMLLVPVIMAKEGWDDHDRSERYTTLAVASNYLNSCAPNAILFTNGDNDTFPLWYAQEVEGVRTDIRVVNLSLLNTEWYIEQMKRKAYDSDPVPFSLPRQEYDEGSRNFTYFLENENIKGYVDIRQLFEILRTDPKKLTMQTHVGPVDYFPTKKFKIVVDSAQVMKTGTLAPEDAGLMVDEITWTINRNGIGKNYLMVLDLLASNNWERPIYFATTTGVSAYIGLEDYFQLEGLTYRFVPVLTKGRKGQEGRINTHVMFDNVVNKFRFGNMDKTDVYLDETSVRMAMNLRNNFYRLADVLISEGRPDSARTVMDLCINAMPDKSIPYNYFIMPIAEGYYEIGEMTKGNEIYSRMIEIMDEQLAYYFAFTGRHKAQFDFEKEQNLAMLQKLIQVARRFKQQDTAQKAEKVFDIYYARYSAE